MEYDCSWRSQVHLCFWQKRAVYTLGLHHWYDSCVSGFLENNASNSVKHYEKSKYCLVLFIVQHDLWNIAFKLLKIIVWNQLSGYKSVRPHETSGYTWNVPLGRWYLNHSYLPKTILLNLVRGNIHNGAVFCVLFKGFQTSNFLRS